MFFLLKKFKLKNKQNIWKQIYLGEREFLFPVNIFFDLLHCYANLIEFELFISITRNIWVFSGYLYYMWIEWLWCQKRLLFYNPEFVDSHF